MKQVRRLFDLPAAPPVPIPAVDVRRLCPGPGQIVLVTGPSGAGKTTLLRLLCESIKHNRIDLQRIRLPDRPVIDCFDAPATFTERLALLSRVGLAEAHTYLRKPGEISEGQRFRLRLAIALARAADRPDRARVGGRSGLCTILCDEFAAPLDDITAAVVARGLRRAIDDSATPLGAILVTGREQLIPALSPDVVARCDFGLVGSDLPAEQSPRTTRPAEHPQTSREPKAPMHLPASRAGSDQAEPVEQND